MALAIKKPFVPYTKYSTQSRPSPKKERAYCTHCKISGHSLETCFKAGNAEALVCSHCHLSGHIMEKCYKLHGYLPGHKLFNKPNNHAVFATQSILSPASNLEEVSDEKVGLTRFQYQ